MGLGLAVQGQETTESCVSGDKAMSFLIASRTCTEHGSHVRSFQINDPTTYDQKISEGVCIYRTRTCTEHSALHSPELSRSMTLH